MWGRKVLCWTQQSSDDLYTLQTRSLIYKSRLPKGGLGSWSKYSCAVISLLHFCLKHLLQKQLATVPVFSPVLVVVADVWSKTQVNYQTLGYVCLTGNLILMCKLKGCVKEERWRKVNTECKDHSQQVCPLTLAATVCNLFPANSFNSTVKTSIWKRIYKNQVHGWFIGPWLTVIKHRGSYLQVICSWHYLYRTVKSMK